MLEDIRRNTQVAKLASEDYMNMLLSIKTEKKVQEINRCKRELKKMERLLPLIQKYTDIAELNAYNLNKPIEKIAIHEKQVDEDGVKS